MGVIKMFQLPTHWPFFFGNMARPRPLFAGAIINTKRKQNRNKCKEIVTGWGMAQKGAKEAEGPVKQGALPGTNPTFLGLHYPGLGRFFVGRTAPNGHQQTAANSFIKHKQIHWTWSAGRLLPHMLLRRRGTPLEH